MTVWGAIAVAQRSPLAVTLLGVALLMGCGAAPRRTPTVPPPMPTPTIPADGDAVLAGFKKALGPKAPMRLRSTTNLQVEGQVLTIITDGDYQGNEMDASMKLRIGAEQLSWDVIAADGKAYIREYRGKWTRSTEAPPKKGSGPFGDMSHAKLKFNGAATSDKRLYTIVWSNPSDAERLIRGTVLTKVRITTSVMTFDVRSTGDPVSARYTMEGTAKYKGRTIHYSMAGFYTFFAIHEPLEFSSPLKK
jgi:hypothetical protein